MNDVVALRRLHLRGYRIHSEGIYYIVNDDTDQGIEEVLIANWDGRAEDAWNALVSHGFPTSPFIMCMTCAEGEAEFAGECVFCARESVSWAKAGEYM